MSPKLLSVREVADSLRVHRYTVYALCDRGKLAHLRVSNAIRIPVEALEAFLKERSLRPNPGA
jgi:excisionase family DNA binding protein